MQSLDNNQQAFLALVRAGLWETDVQLLPFGAIDFSQVLTFAEEQSVVGLVAAGIEHVVDSKVPKQDALQFVGETLQLEQRNSAMNYFIGVIVDKMRDEGIYTLLVKGQGIAQCYKRPLLRSCGDVDFFLREDNYQKAKSYLIPMADSVDPESGKHQGMTIGPWVVELHGNLHCGLTPRMDKLIDEVQDDVFYGGNVRSWMNGKTQVFMPSVDNDLILLFTHFLKHFYKGGLGMRQVCDWCRFLWTYRDTIDKSMLEKRLMKMGLVSEWKAFGAYAVNFLGMPLEAMPLLDNNNKWKRKARKINTFILAVGNFGHNRDEGAKRNPFLIRKMISFSHRIADFFNHLKIFPLDTLRFFPVIVFNGFRLAAKGIG